MNESRTGRKSGVTWNMWRTERTTIQIQIQANADEEYFVTLSSPSANRGLEGCLSDASLLFLNDQCAFEASTLYSNISRVLVSLVISNHPH